MILHSSYKASPGKWKCQDAAACRELLLFRKLQLLPSMGDPALNTHLPRLCFNFFLSLRAALQLLLQLLNGVLQKVEGCHMLM